MNAYLLPPPHGCCKVCGRNHAENAAHDRDSLFYQSRFMAEHRRAPTWRDATAHLSESDRDLWLTRIREVCEEKGLDFAELPEGSEPVAEPYEMVYEMVDDGLGRRSVPINMNPVEFAMDGSGFSFIVRVAERPVPAVVAEIKQQLALGEVELSDGSESLMASNVREAQAAGLIDMRVEWVAKTQEISGKAEKVE